MKKFLFLCSVCLFLTAGAFGQSVGGSMSADTRMLYMPEHPQHASQTGMAQEQDIREHSDSISGHGERPLWEVMPEPQFVSLGAIARQYREQHATVKKATVAWKN